VSTLKKVIESQKADLERTTNQANELERQLQAEIRNGDIQIKRLSNKIIININDRISFDSGYSSLKPSVKPALNKIIKILKNYPDNNISIEGHTDNVPIRHCHFQDNWQLSTERALSVLRYILAGSNLDAHRFSAMGYGEYQPRVPNSTPDNRTQNRRVDIIVVPNRNAVSKFN
jgi:chemotaxis protein MotB